MTMPILRPATVDLVAAESVEAIMAATQRELSSLDEQRIAAEAAADEAERRAAGGTADPAFHDWAAAHLDRFVCELREQHDREMRELIESAERRGRAVVERAQVDADVLVSYAHALRGTGGPNPVRALPAPAPAREDVAQEPNPARLVWRPGDTSQAESANEPSPWSRPTVDPVTPAAALVVDVPAPAAPIAPPPPFTPLPPYTPPVVESAPPAFPPPVVTPSPGAEAPLAAAPTAPPVAPPMYAPPVFAPPSAAPPPGPETLPVPMPLPEMPPPAPAVDAATETPPAPAPAPAGRKAQLGAWLHRLPTFAILQVLAVIVVLIIVLIKIG